MFKPAGLLTTYNNGNVIWSNFKSGDADIAYIAQVNNGYLDLQNVTGSVDYTLKIFGLYSTGADSANPGMVTTLAEEAVTGLSVGSDGVIHMKIGNSYNSGVGITLTNGATVDLAGSADNNITVAAAGDTGKLNLSSSSYVFSGDIVTNGTLTVGGTGVLKGTVNVASGAKLAIDDGAAVTVNTQLNLVDATSEIHLGAASRIIFSKDTVFSTGKMTLDVTGTNHPVMEFNANISLSGTLGESGKVVNGFTIEPTNPINTNIDIAEVDIQVNAEKTMTINNPLYSSRGIGNLTMKNGSILDLGNDGKATTLLVYGDFKAGDAAGKSAKIRMDIIDENTTDHLIVMGNASGKLDIDYLNIQNELMQTEKPTDTSVTCLNAIDVEGNNDMDIGSYTTAYGDYIYTFGQVKVKWNETEDKIEIVESDVPIGTIYKDNDGYVVVENMAIDAGGNVIKARVLTKSTGYKIGAIIKNEESGAGSVSQYAFAKNNYNFTNVGRKKSDGTIAFNIAEADKSQYEIVERNFGGNWGTLGTAGRTFIISGNDSSIFGSGYAGITVETGANFNLNNVKVVDDFEGGIFATNNGKVSIGNGDTALGATPLYLNNSITGEGALEIASGQVILGSKASQYAWKAVEATDDDYFVQIGDKYYKIEKTDETKIGDVKIEQKKLKIFAAAALEANGSQLDVENIDNEGILTLTGGTLSKAVTNNGTLKTTGDVKFDGVLDGTDGKLVVESGKLIYTNSTAGSIKNDVEIQAGAIMDPDAGVFSKSVNNSGKLVLEGGTLGVAVTNNSGSTLSVTNPVALTTGGSIAFASGSTLDVGTKLGEAVLTGINDASMLNIASGSILDLAGDNIVNGGTYTILQGTAVKNVTNLWDESSINFDPRVTHKRWVSGDDTVAMQVNFTTDAELNVLGLAGVQQGMISINNQIADAVAEHLRSALKDKQDNDAYDIEIWATYIHNKDTVQGLTTGGYDSNYKAQYNGVTVGMDLETSRKAITGVALTYATGDTNGSGADAQIRNESKYYGISLYNRVTNKHSAIITDMSFTHGKNELDVIQFNGSEADAKVNSFSAGVRWEKDIQLKGSKITPFAGVRYLFLQNRDFTNSKNLNYTTDNQNLIIPKVGLAWSGEYKMTKSQWTAKPHAEIGYLWNLGNRKADVMTSVYGYPLDSSFYVTDKNSYYLKAGIEFALRNLSCGFGYSYAKGDAIRNNRWNVNLNYSF